MAESFVQGFLATIIIDGADTTPITVDVTLSQSKTVLDKSTMDGTGFANSIPGMRSGNLAFNGNISQAELNVLQASYDKDVPVTFSLTIAQGLGTDGNYSGSFVFETFDKDTSAEDNWGFSAGGPTVGAVVYLPSVP